MIWTDGTHGRMDTWTHGPTERRSAVEWIQDERVSFVSFGLDLGRTSKDSVRETNHTMAGAIDWTITDYRLVRNIAQETSALVDKCRQSKQFGNMFFRQHEQDLRDRIRDLTEFKHRATREGREERILINKQVIRLRQLLLDLQKEARQELSTHEKGLASPPPRLPASTVPLPPPPPPAIGDTAIVVVDDKAMTQDERKAQETSLLAGMEEKRKIHDRLFRSRTKSMVIADAIENKYGTHPFKKQEALKSTFHNTLRSAKPSEARRPPGQAEKTQVAWRHSTSPPKNADGTTNNKMVKDLSQLTHCNDPDKHQPLYRWEEGYDGSHDGGQHEESSKFHTSMKAKELRAIAQHPEFKLKHHNIGFGSRVPIPGDHSRFDPLITHHKQRKTSMVQQQTMEVLLDFQIQLTREEYETYKLLGLGVPVERSATHNLAIKEAAAQAVHQLSDNAQ
jgi:hypothetical protein